MSLSCEIGHCGKISAFQEIFTSTVILWSFDIFLMFSNFLRSYISSYLATREATGTYQLITSYHVLSHLWWKENLLTIKKSQKIMNMIVSLSKFAEFDDDVQFFHCGPEISFLEKCVPNLMLFKILFLSYFIWL